METLPFFTLTCEQLKNGLKMTLRYFKKRLSAILFDGDNHIKLLNLRYLPRWIVVVLDTFVAGVSMLIAFYVINNITVAFYPVLTLWQQGFFILLTHVAFFFVFSTYSGVIRHSTFVDIIKIALACFSAMFVLFLVNYTYYFLYHQKIFLFPFIIVNMALTFTGMLSIRVAVKSLYSVFATVAQEVSYRVLIVGVDDDTIAIADAINASTNKRFILAGFISMKNSYGTLKILETPVFKFQESLFEDLEYLKIDGVLMVGDKLSVKNKNNIADLCLANNLKIYSVPVINEWDSEEKESLNIQKIQIEDLLERNVIALDDKQIKNFLNDKTILVTGGAGSIGSEIVKQISYYNPIRVIVLDQAESPLHELELEMRSLFPDIDYHIILGDLRNSDRVSQIFKENDIDVVFHAAAYKHVPLIERNPREAVQVNIMGTATLANLARVHNVSKFVMVSTDKAVNPTNVMGATKRAAEIYVQSLQAAHPNGTKFITTRFGNVLGSNGSVIPHFKRQIEQGGPVTVTHQDIIRYFMTIHEACQLVLQAGTMGNGGEVYVFDMGKPVRIMDLAEKMIKLSGFVPFKDINIEITGLRPGEKLFEELLIDERTTVATHHKKILIAIDEPLDFNEVEAIFLALEKASRSTNEIAVVTLIKKLVPEYISQNSVYELLDNKQELGS